VLKIKAITKITVRTIFVHLQKKVLPLRRKIWHKKSIVLKMETATYRIEIDCLGEDNYRYRSWKVDAPQVPNPI
jgi:hypothetical protein